MIVSEKGRYVRFEVGVWLNEKDGAIHLAANGRSHLGNVRPGIFHSQGADRTDTK